MTAQQILAELESLGSESCKRIFINHGAREPLFGVKVQDLKKLQKLVKKNYELSLELYDTGNTDAQYLAGLIADEKKMTRKDLQHWADAASWHMLCENIVPWVAAETAHGYGLALEWIGSNKETVQAAGWSTLSSLVSLKPNDELDLEKLKDLMHQVETFIHTAPNRVRYAMNGYLIAIGCFVPSLTMQALKVGKALGKITVDMGKTSCKVPYAPEYIQKVIDRGRVGKKKKAARC